MFQSGVDSFALDPSTHHSTILQAPQKAKRNKAPKGHRKRLFVDSKDHSENMTQSRLVRTLFRRALVVTPAYALLCQTCPEDDFFNFKSEMRCVLQGKYLPSFHSDKPKNVVEEAAALAKAGFITEILDSTKHYHVDVIPLLPGAVKLALVEIKSIPDRNSMFFFWLGFAGGWIWIYGDRKALVG